MSTYKETLDMGAKRLKEANINNPSYDARMLLEYVLKCDWAYILMNYDAKLTLENEKEYYRYVSKRESHFPLQYITKSCGFMDFDFVVKEGVLIPRQDTEILVEEVLKHTLDDMQILDMCCGSGCIGISIYKYCCDSSFKRNESVYNNITIDLADISDKAIELSKQNAENIGAKVNVINSDIYTNISNKYDIIVSNPPYIRTDVINTLMEEVKEYEPIIALDGMEDGLYFYKSIIKDAKKYLKKGGYIFFEIGFDQADDVEKIFLENNFCDVIVKKDLANLDRVIYAHIK